ncbi:MAG: hypothetical protein PF541_00885 [Prolixibacteraceae bacterium]|jgi:hypothetical protein|nr:hypothetical protein [Prolixibacteraceae bacterium]
MKTDMLVTNMKSVFVGASTFILIFFLTSCTPKIPFNTSTVVPAAEGYVTVKTDNNLNYEIKISVSNLAEVENLMPLDHVYVVWIVTEQDSTINIGGLITSKKLNAVFNTVTSFKPVQIVITAEEDTNISSPIGKMVLTTEKFWE